jgi:hypothetical protein
MKAWIAARLEQARWLSFAAWFAALVGYSAWAFGAGGPWKRALDSAGGRLPEMQPGFPGVEPERTIEALGARAGDYLLFQAVDIPYALLTFMASTVAIAVALRTLRLQSSPLRLLLIPPLVYFACEIVENALLAAFAAKLIPPIEAIVLVQQAATAAKLAAGVSSMLIGAAGLVVALIALAVRRAKSRT